jgi:hypothetical protein
MSHKGRVPRRLSHAEVDPAAPVAMWFLLTALAGQGAELRAHARVFCAEVGNARMVDAVAGNESGLVCVYVVVDGGDVAGAVQGDARAVAGVVTARLLVSRLFMFSPVLVPEPAGQQSA